MILGLLYQIQCTSSTFALPSIIVIKKILIISYIWYYITIFFCNHLKTSSFFLHPKSVIRFCIGQTQQQQQLNVFHANIQKWLLLERVYRETKRKKNIKSNKSQTKKNKERWKQQAGSLIILILSGFLLFSLSFGTMRPVVYSNIIYIVHINFIRQFLFYINIVFYFCFQP